MSISATPTPTLPAGCGSGAGAPEDPLACATISIPQWPDEVAATCPTGPVTLDNGYYLDAATNLILSVAPGVVTPVPGGTHVIAQVFCDGLEGSSGADSPTQVLAYAMDGTAFTFIEAIDVVSEDADITSWAEASLDSLERNLRDKDFLLGAEFSAADVMVGYTVLVAKAMGLIGAEHPSVDAYLSRLTERPALRRALRA